MRRVATVLCLLLSAACAPKMAAPLPAVTSVQPTCCFPFFQPRYACTQVDGGIINCSPFFGPLAPIPVCGWKLRARTLLF
jgi:hypothetical protein